MLAVVDFHARFLYVLAGNGDSLVFSTSRVKRRFENEETIFNSNSVILCESAFSSLEYIVKSTDRIGSGSARAVVEHAFGQFKAQFRLFSIRSELSPESHTLVLTGAAFIYFSVNIYILNFICLLANFNVKV